MASFLSVLKILGIVLLAIVGLVLFILILVLFVPVRYRAEGFYKNGEYGVRAKGSWLLHIVTYIYILGDEDKSGLRIFGIKSGKKDKDEEPRKEKIIEGFNDDLDVPVSQLMEESEKEPAVTESFHEEKPEEKEQPVKDNKKKKEKKKRVKKSKNTSKKEGIYDRIKGYIEIIKTEEFKVGYELCKKQISRLLKQVFPRKWEIKGSAGFEDPLNTGKLCAALGVLYPWMHEHVKVTGDFESTNIDVRAYAKGRIYIVVLVAIFIKVYFNKNLKHLLTLFKNETSLEDNNG